MGINDELNDEEQAIMVFLKRYFEQAGMPNALWILNESERIADVQRFLIVPGAFSKARGELSNLMVRYLARSCLRCNGYVGITIRQPGHNAAPGCEWSLYPVFLSYGVDSNPG